MVGRLSTWIVSWSMTPGIVASDLGEAAARDPQAVQPAFVVPLIAAGRAAIHSTSARQARQVALRRAKVPRPMVQIRCELNFVCDREARLAPGHPATNLSGSRLCAGPSFVLGRIPARVGNDLNVLVAVRRG